MRDIQNHFAGVANQYAAFRPTYPRQLLADLATLAAGEHTVALDVAAGNGQATSMLADYVDHVYASDVALSQIQAMPAHPHVSAYVARAEASGLQAHCIDLITVAQAMHWFDVDAFHREVRRVVRPGGVIAVWSYALLHATPTINDVINDLYRTTGPWWPADRAHVDDGYANLAFPYPLIPYTPPAMTAQFDVARLLGYLGTWSGVQRYKKATGDDPVAARSEAFRAAWGGADTQSVTFTFDVTMRVGRVG